MEKKDREEDFCKQQDLMAGDICKGEEEDVIFNQMLSALEQDIYEGRDEEDEEDEDYDDDDEENDEEEDDDDDEDEEDDDYDDEGEEEDEEEDDDEEEDEEEDNDDEEEEDDYDDEDDEEEFAFYEESGGVTKEQAIEMIQGLSISPDTPMGVVGGGNDYGIASYPSFVLIFFNGDSDHPMRIEKRAFMPLQGIMQDVNYYMAQEDFDSAADCVLEAIEKNVDSDRNWGIYCTAGEIFWRLREMELAGNMFMQAYQCSDCDQKAHVLCQAAATYCIMQRPDVGYALYHKALQEEPESLEALHDLGGFHWDMGEFEDAAKYYFSVLKKDPNYYASYEELSNLFAQLGNTVWPKPFMDCFEKEHALAAEKLAAAEADMLALLAKQQ